MSKLFFLSHSSDDSTIAEKVAKRLGEDQCWLYEWEVKPGDSIFEFDRAIADSRIFVLFWSANAEMSTWVEDEVSQARIRVSRDKGFRLVVVRLDNTPLPPFLEYRHWVGGVKGVNHIVSQLLSLQNDLTPEETIIGKPVFRDSFQNRQRELDLLEQATFSQDSPIMILGLAGIGKTSLVKRALATMLSHLTVIWVDLEVASTPIRLLASIAKPLSIQVDPSEVAAHSLEFWQTKLLPEIRESDRLLIVFDNFQTRVASGGMKSTALMELLETMCLDLAQIHKPGNPSIIVVSSMEPDFSEQIKVQFKTIEIGTLDKKSVTRALRFNLSRISLIDHEPRKLERLAEHIRGYPAAITIVAQRVGYQGIDAVLADITGLRRLRYHIGYDLISQLSLEPQERDLLILLSTAVAPLSDRHLKIILKGDLTPANKLARKQMLDPTTAGYSLHMILRDFVSESMATPGDILQSHSQLADLFSREWHSAPIMSAARAQFGSLAYFHTVSSGRRRLAKLIEADYLEEAKQAGVELYRRGQYTAALGYLESARKMDRDSDPIFDFYYALSLHRLDQHREALPILEGLVTRFPRISRYHHGLGTVLRTLDKHDEAMQAFRNAVSLASRLGRVTPLCSLADILCDLKRSDEAVPLIQEALQLAPGDSFVVATASRVLDEAGNPDEALAILLDALRISPGDARLHHRAGMILKKIRRFSEAKDHLERASLAPPLRYSVIALADVYLELGDDDKAEEALEKLPGQKQRSVGYLSAKANILRRRKDYAGAESHLKRALRIEPHNMVLYGGMLQIKLDQARQHFSEGNRQGGLIRIGEAKEYLSKYLEIEKDSPVALSMGHTIQELEREIGHIP